MTLMLNGASPQELSDLKSHKLLAPIPSFRSALVVGIPSVFVKKKQLGLLKSYQKINIGNDKSIKMRKKRTSSHFEGEADINL